MTTLTYAATVDDAEEPFVVDGSDWHAPRQFAIELLSGIRSLVEVQGRWRQRATVRSNGYVAGHFARWVGHWDDPNLVRLAQPQCIADLTPAMWSAYALSLGSSPNDRRKQIQLALMLKSTGLLSEQASQRVLARKGSVDSGEVEHYSDDEFRAIITAAKRVVRLAHERITANYAAACSSAEHAGEPTRESILFEMLTTTYPRSKPKARLLGTVSHLTWRNNARGTMDSGVKILKEPARLLLFPDQGEALAAMVLLASLRGLNLSQITTMSIPDRSIDSAGVISQVQTDKPRRGPRRRFSLEIFGEAGDDADGRWLRRIEEMTEPLRHHLRIIGQESGTLILYMSLGKATNRTPGSNERDLIPWSSGLPVINFLRLKRTYETRYSRESVQNTEATHIAVYVRRDPERVAEYQDRASVGIERAMKRALKDVQLRVISDDSPELVDAVDSAFAACIDPEHEPRTGLPCHDGFLGCLSCPNAIATDRHLPMMRYTLNLLEEIRAALPSTQWEERFARAHAQLTQILKDAPSTPEQRRVTKAQQHLIRRCFGLSEEIR